MKGLVWRDNEDVHCWRVCKSKIVFGNNDVVEGTPNLVAPYRFDRNSKGGGLLLYLREDMPSKILNCGSNCDIEILVIEINLRKRKWL